MISVSGSGEDLHRPSETNSFEVRFATCVFILLLYIISGQQIESFATTKMFSFDDIPSLSGKVAIVTGASAGIGLVTARELAKKGCHVILACRSKDKTQAVMDALKPLVSDPTKLEFMPLNNMNLKSVYSFVEAFRARNLPLHILVNNAGIMIPPFTLSDDGIESQFATNHVAQQALTVGLLPILEASAPSRVVVVSSSAHQLAPRCGIDFDHINDPSQYSAWTWYGQSKLANILFARELSRQLRQERNIENVYVNVLHPGVIRTELTRYTSRILQWIMYPFQRNADDGAKTQLYLATSEDVVENQWHGRFFNPIATLAETSALGQDVELGKKLWTFTRDLIAEKMG
jgi:NAD(P)-dependent dehydrogenase (short-subunit alcohol dehydrogenase family)